ncbi:helix-turn-helix domain-containing protein [Myroides odoratus]|uniref:HTH-type transcriptional activator hxlR n=1 Tax=Myroides odoratus TaxID=256 RepID=A0A378RKB8_MYROD|nr:helix-turn-helix domain-containing protein [Myroides odoratus]MCS4238647.1 DNA-binding HxlR family transcriptional regulator [Myroides odoratus]MDH6600419.1 DNA-binding HxlR family transcriptional regulator [Myroides gitamensis]QQU05077.1 helix-turn-helix transcriptional regulator [Myroides odoratus]STZ27444.1 HTH-type transcriptional activator hxlR [Myroides odoratus]
MTAIKNDQVPTETILALRDALELLSGKWKFCILHHLHTKGEMRFKDLQEKAQGISPKVLSNELQALEDNLFITRTVNKTKPITVSYQLTAHAQESYPVLTSLIEFGLKHRAKIKNK